MDGVGIFQVQIRVLPDGRVLRRHAALYLDISEKTLANLKTQGKGPPVKKVGGKDFYFLSDLEAYVARGGDRLSRDDKSR